ncbi:MAG: GDSL-type esterase/lipase family protein [Butyrivibrio sp.]|nr:GDSL-type esterase/lipase family protein [Butyrivibrio sp.]
MRKKMGLAIAGIALASVMGLTACGKESGSPSETTETQDMATQESKTEEQGLSEKSFTPTEEYVKQIGRSQMNSGNVLWLIHSGSAVEFTFTGTEASVIMQGDSSATPGNRDSAARFAVYVDDERVMDEQMLQMQKEFKIPLSGGEKEYKVKIIKLSEAANSIIGIKSINVTSDGDIKPTEAKDLRIEFIGDSITCGYGVDDEVKENHFSTSTEDATKAYAFKTAALLDADYSLVSFSGHGIISGYSGDGSRVEEQTVPPVYAKLGKSYASGGNISLDETDWDFSRFVPDIVVVNLGTNDASYTGSNKDKRQEYTDGYVEFLKVVREKNPDAHILCTLGIMGADLCGSMHDAVDAYVSATGDEKVSYMDFDVQSASDGYAADWHPTEKTHEKAAKKLAEEIESLIK